MTSESKVQSAAVVFGTPGTATFVAAGSTDTSKMFPLPRQDFSVSIAAYGSLVTTTASTTASSTAAATVAMQGSNDGQAWFGISSASATSTLMSTSTGVVLGLAGTAVAVLDVAAKRYAYGRAVVAVVGTGSAQAHMAF